MNRICNPRMFACTVVAACVSALFATPVRAATIVTGDVTANLGPNFFIDDAATGGNDITVNEPAVGVWTRNFGALNVGTGGTNIQITGVGWASPDSSVIDATSMTVSILYLGVDGVFGGGNDVLIGTVSDNFTRAAAGEYYWQFDAPISAVIDGANSLFRISLSPHNAGNNGSMRFKSTNTNFNNVKLSVAGTSTAGEIPEPASLGALALGMLAIGFKRRRA